MKYPRITKRRKHQQPEVKRGVLESGKLKAEQCRNHTVENEKDGAHDRYAE